MALVLVVVLFVSRLSQAGPICEASADIARAESEARQEKVSLRTVVSLIEAPTQPQRQYTYPESPD